MDKDEKAYNQLLKGIELYVNECIKNSGFDKTFIGLIEEIKPNNQYDITINDITYSNIKTIGGTCKIGEVVKVLVPQNNFSNMFILK